MDYDGDGDLDILSGSYTGEVYLFVRDDDGTFQQGVFLTTHEGGPLKTGTSITPEAHDLDGDGDLDLLIGTRSSGVFWHENLGTRTEPSIAAKGKRLKTRGGQRISGSNAHFADWDHDGTRDLVLGSEWGDVVWHKNLGTDTKPEFAEVEKLIDIRQFGFEKIQRDQGATHPGSRTKVHVADWNGDGQLDLLVGDVRWLYYTENPLTEAEKKEKDALQPKYDAALDAYMKLSREQSAFTRKKEPVPAELAQRFEAAKTEYNELSKTMRTYNRDKSETHGYVWLYLRNGAPAEAAEPIRSEQAKDASVSLQAEARPSGDTIEVTLRLSIDAGWHTYASVPPDSPYPLTIPSLKLPEGFEQVGGFEAEGARVPATDGSGATWFLGKVAFKAKVRRKPGAIGQLGAVVSMQVCNEEICMPPTELAVMLELGNGR